MQILSVQKMPEVKFHFFGIYETLPIISNLRYYATKKTQNQHTCNEVEDELTETSRVTIRVAEKDDRVRLVFYVAQFSISQNVFFSLTAGLL